MKDFDDLKRSIYDFFDSNRTKKYTEEDLIKMFNVSSYEEKAFKMALIKLQIEEKLFFTHEYYMAFPSNSSLKVGKVKYKNNYYIYQGNKKIIIPDKFSNNCINGDYVLYEINKMYNGTYFAKVKNIVYRQTNELIFDCIKTKDEIKLVPYSNGFNYDLKLSNSDYKKLVNGERVLIKLKDFNGESYTGEIIEYVGHKDDPNLFIKTIAIQNNVSIDFPKDVIKEVNKVPQEVSEEELKGRIDYRNKQIFTIDGKNTKDIDDAISLEILDNGNYLLGVHIADVSYYVKYGSPIFNDAKLRGNSYYLANYVIPMLHHLLSNGICSLNEGEDRLTISCMMTIDKKGKVIDYKIEESVINSKKKMNYDDVNDILKGKNISSYEEFSETLNNMKELHLILDKKKKQRGYINFGDNDMESSMENGEVLINIPKRDTAEKMIEDFMLIANETVATHVFNMYLPFLYRCHDKPDKVKLKQIIKELQEEGYEIKIHKNLDDNYCLQDILRQLEKYEEYPILSEKILQGIKRAMYTPDNIGHFGLALKLYTHFTSPIRRFIDLMVHTLLKYYINGTTQYITDDLYEELEEIAKHCNNTSKQSDNLEREVNNKIMLMYLEQHYEDIFNVTICSITKNYLIVKTDKEIYGKILVNDLDDKYKYDKNNNMLYNQHRILKVGNKIDVMIKEIDNEKVMFTYPNSSITRTRKK